MWHPPPPVEVETSQPRQVWFSFDSTTVLSICELSPCVPRLYLFSKVMQLPAAFLHFWYLSPHLHLFNVWSPTVDNPTLLTQDFSFLHFCNHKQNRSGCLQKIYPPSQASYPVSPVCISKMLWTFPSRYLKRIFQISTTVTLLSYLNLLYIRNHRHWLSVLTAYAESLFVDWNLFVKFCHLKPLLIAIVWTFLHFRKLTLFSR